MASILPSQYGGGIGPVKVVVVVVVVKGVVVDVVVVMKGVVRIVVVDLVMGSCETARGDVVEAFVVSVVIMFVFSVVLGNCFGDSVWSEFSLEGLPVVGLVMGDVVAG
jgi:hypothetical protein